MDIVHSLQQSDSRGTCIGHGTCTGRGKGDGTSTDDGTVTSTSSGTGTRAGAEDLNYHRIADELVKFRERIYMSDDSDLKKVIFGEFHVKLNSSHPGYQKTLTKVKRPYYWHNLKIDVAEFVARCFDSL